MKNNKKFVINNNNSPIKIHTPLSARYQSSINNIKPYSGLNGRHYTLKGDSSQFIIPKIDLIDNEKFGELDKWPTSSRNKNINLPNIENIDKNNKPKLLYELEQYLDEELTVLGSKDTSNPAVLQVYRECFIVFMNEFQTYKPFLQLILNAYEHMLESYKYRLQSIVPLKTKLGSIEQDTQRKIEIQRERYNNKIRELENNIEILQKRCDEYGLRAPSLKMLQNDYEYQIRVLSEKCDEIKERNHSLLQTINRAEDDVDKYRKEIQSLESQITKIPSLERQNELLSAEIDKYKQEKINNDENIKSIQNMQMKIQILEKELEKEKHNNILLNNRLDGKDDETKANDERYQQLLNNLNGVISQRERLMTDIKDLEKEWKAQLLDLDVLTYDSTTVMDIKDLGELMIKTIRNLKS